MDIKKIKKLFAEFLANYDSKKFDDYWEMKSKEFTYFWESKVCNYKHKLSDNEIDEIVRIFDINALKDKAKDPMEAITRPMIAQKQWKIIFNAIQNRKDLLNVITNILKEKNFDKKAEYIDQFCEADRKEHIANFTDKEHENMIGINLFLVAWDTKNNLGVCSLKHREKILNFLGLNIENYEQLSTGRKIVATGTEITEFFKNLGITASAMTINRFLYHSEIRKLWEINEQIYPDEINEEDMEYLGEEGAKKTGIG